MTFLPQNGFKGKLKYVSIFDIAEKRERSKRWLSHITITIHTQNMLVLKATIMLHYLFNNKRSFYLNSSESALFMAGTETSELLSTVLLQKGNVYTFVMRM